MGTDLVKDPRRARGRLRRLAGRHRRVQPQRAARAQPRAATPTSTPTTSSTWRCSTATTSGSRCACARAASTPTHVRDLDLDVHFDAGEELRTEISAKFTPERLEGDLAAAGLELARWLTDPDDLFALTLSRSRRDAPSAVAADRCSRAMEIEGSAAIVVGGASGLGEATVRALHARGAHRDDRRRQRREGRRRSRRSSASPSSPATCARRTR